MSSSFKLDRHVELSSESKLVAERELRETPERVKESLARIRELLKENPDLYFGDSDEVFTIFLRRCKWYPESALAMMRKMAEFKRDNAHLLSGLRPEHVKDAVMRCSNVIVLPKRDPRGRRFTVCHFGDVFDPSKISPDELFQWLYLVNLMLILEPESQVNGFTSVTDYHNMGWKQITSLSPAWLKRQTGFLQQVLPSRLKEAHIIRQPMIFNVFWQVAKTFLTEKNNKRTFLHGNKFSSLHKHIPPACLPKDYGGELPPVNFDGEVLYQQMLEHRDFIEAFDSYGFVKK